MELYKGKYRVASARLGGWDYSASAYYFVTMCTQNRAHYFGRVENGEMVLSRAGKIAKQELLKTAALRKNIVLVAWVIMPNHVHVIIQILDAYVMNDSMRDNNALLNNNAHWSGDGRDVARNVSTVAFQTPNGIRRASCVPRIDMRHTPPTEKNKWFSSISPKPQSLSTIIRAFKSAVTKQCAAQNIDFTWQPRFHDRIIWNVKSLHRACMYIQNNPKKWHRNRNNYSGIYM